MANTSNDPLDELCINTIRALSMDAVQQANSGHPGTPMGAAAMAYTLWTRFLRHNPANPDWPDRDRFVLSPGHASMLLYSLLHLTGYDLPIEELERFRQWGSRTPGHPEYGHTPGVEATTGPLGAGFAMGVGMAIAERFLAEHFNHPDVAIVDHHVYGIVSDGDLMEGVASEAASLAGTLGLGRLIYLYDDNQITIEGDTDLAFSEFVGARFNAYGWQCLHVEDGNDVEAIAAAIEEAHADDRRPSLILAKTTIGFGSPGKADSAEAHGAPLGEDEVRATKRALGWPEDARFLVPDAVRAAFRPGLDRGAAWEREWRERVEAHTRAYPDEGRLWRTVSAGELPAGWDAHVPSFDPADGSLATRAASGQTLNGLVVGLPLLLGGSADLAPSTNTELVGYGDLGLDEWNNHNMHFGVREHAMGNIVNGLALHGGVIPYGATFLIFSDYMRPALRLAALQGAPAIFIFTHDSIGLGEDGPTHQPIEQLASLRAIPGLTVFRPADANETAECWRVAIERRGPAVLALSRQGLPILEPTEALRAGVRRGGYVLREATGGPPELMLIATGSEVAVALGAADLLAAGGVRARVVSMPCTELFDEQDAAYRAAVLPPELRARVSIEAASSFGWQRYVGEAGEIVAIDRFGASAPAARLFEEFGFTAEAVGERARATLARQVAATAVAAGMEARA